MANYRVLNISSPDGVTIREFIPHIGYFESNEKPLVIIPVAEAVVRTKINPQVFHAQNARNEKVHAAVVRPVAWRPFLKTTLDFLQKEQLLSLEQLHHRI